MKREEHANRVREIINSCTTIDHVDSARVLVMLFEKQYDDTIPFRYWINLKERSILDGTHYHIDCPNNSNSGRSVHTLSNCLLVSERLR